MKDRKRSPGERIDHRDATRTALVLGPFTGEGPVVRRSKRISFAGILYLIGIAAWRVSWTDRHGI
jgi:hypothetical protein